jgi:hypothetical protein
MVAVNKKASEPWLSISYAKVTTLKVFRRHLDFIIRYGISVSQITTFMFRLSQSQSGPFLDHGISPDL